MQLICVALINNASHCVSFLFSLHNCRIQAAHFWVRVSSRATQVTCREEMFVPRCPTAFTSSSADSKPAVNLFSGWNAAVVRCWCNSALVALGALGALGPRLHRSDFTARCTTAFIFAQLWRKPFVKEDKPYKTHRPKLLSTLILFLTAVLIGHAERERLLGLSVAGCSSVRRSFSSRCRSDRPGAVYHADCLRAAG